MMTYFGDDKDAIEVLEDFGVKIDEFTIYTEDGVLYELIVYDAIDYLCDEWDWEWRTLYK